MQPDSTTISSAVAFIAQQPLPFQAGSLTVTRNGVLRSVPPRDSVRFQFEHYGIPMSAKAWREEDGEGRVRIDGTLGPLPYSVEAPDARKRILEVLYAARFMEQPFLMLAPDQTIVLCAETKVAAPVKPVSVITAACSLVLDARPYLELIAEALAEADRPATP